VSFNDSWPTIEAQATDQLLFPQLNHRFHVPEYTVFNDVFEVEKIAEGWNEVSVYNGSHQSETAEDRWRNSVVIRSVELAIWQDWSCDDRRPFRTGRRGDTETGLFSAEEIGNARAHVFNLCFRQLREHGQ
jgi:hypothetical protein